VIFVTEILVFPNYFFSGNSFFASKLSVFENRKIATSSAFPPSWEISLASSGYPRLALGKKNPSKLASIADPEDLTLTPENGRISGLFCPVEVSMGKIWGKSAPQFVPEVFRLAAFKLNVSKFTLLR
jgi:hypothetical protein